MRSVYKLNYASMTGQRCLSCIGKQQDIAISLVSIKTTTNTGKKPINLEKSARRKCPSHSNHKVFSENYIYDPLNVFHKPIEAINFRFM